MMHSIVCAMLWLLVFAIPWEESVALPALGTLSRTMGYAALFVGLGAIVHKGAIRPLNKIYFAMILFLGWTCLSLAWSASGELTVGQIVVNARLLGMAWLVWEFADTIPRQLSLMQAYVLGCLVPIAGQFLALIYGERLAGTIGRFSGGGLNLNQLAFILVLGIHVAFYLSREPMVKSKILRRIYLAICPLAGIAVLLTGSRTGLIVLAGSAALSVLLHARRSLLTSFVVLAIAGSVGWGFLKLAPEMTIERFQQTPTDVTHGTWAGRTLILQKGLEIAAKHPFVGTGDGTFTEVIGKVGSERKSGVGRAPHNTYLGVLVQTGAVGLILFLSIFAIACNYALRMPPRQRNLWIVLLAVGGVTGVAMDCNTLKATWLFLGLLASNHATVLDLYRREWVRRPILAGPMPYR